MREYGAGDHQAVRRVIGNRGERDSDCMSLLVERDDRYG